MKMWLAAQARDAFNAGASIMHVHVRMQEEGMGHMPNSAACCAPVSKIRFICPMVTRPAATAS